MNIGIYNVENHLLTFKDIEDSIGTFDGESGKIQKSGTSMHVPIYHLSLSVGRLPCNHHYALTWRWLEISRIEARIGNSIQDYASNLTKYKKWLRNGSWGTILPSCRFSVRSRNSSRDEDPASLTPSGRLGTREERRYDIAALVKAARCRKILKLKILNGDIRVRDIGGRQLSCSWWLLRDGGGAGAEGPR